MEKRGQNAAMKKSKAAKVKDPADPVKNFEKWKKKYNRKKAQVKRERFQTKKKPEWLVEREYIAGLVSRYSDINAKEAVKFSDFPLSKKTLLGLQEAQYRQPTEIQRQTIGSALRGKDVLGAAKTGSGKTLAFLIPVLECLYRQQWSSMDGLGALIISPTRELAYQTFEVLRKVGKNHDFSAGLVIGGKDLKNESERIHRTNIVICTPGRLLQHMDQTATFHASSLHMLVLDEADRILDMGFADTLNAIVENLPKSRQTLLFSATQTKSVKDLARLSLKDPEYVWVHEKAKFSTPATLEQNYVVCDLAQKVNMLYSFIRSHLQKKIIVFFACCKEVQYLFRAFCRLRPGMPILALHGKQQQMKRVEVYRDFLKKQNAVLFATDIAARGLDFPAVNWVLQFDCPEDADTYIHRVGRTARYKEGGEALLLLVPSEEKGMIKQLQEKKVPINKIQVNADKVQSVQQKLEAFLAQEKEQKERAQRCFVSYLRSVYLMKNREVFDVFKLQIKEYALSLGLAVAPRVRFLSKAQAQMAVKEGQREEELSEEEEEQRSLKAKLNPHEDTRSSESEDSSDGEESDQDQESRQSPVMGAGNSDDDDDLRDFDLLTVKRKDVFNLTENEESSEPVQVSQKKTEKETKFTDVKRVLKRKFQVNTKVTFNEEGEAVQLWPPVQRTVTCEDEEELEEVSGINVEKAKERLKREDQEFDKQEYSRKVKAKHREKRLKAKAAKRAASKQHERKSDEEEEEDEVLAYLANHSEDEFDPSTLPDPDAQHSDEEEDQPRPAKRHHDSGNSDNEEEELTVGKKKRRSFLFTVRGLSLSTANAARALSHSTCPLPHATLWTGAAEVIMATKKSDVNDQRSESCVSSLGGGNTPMQVQTLQVSAKCGSVTGMYPPTASPVPGVNTASAPPKVIPAGRGYQNISIVSAPELQPSSSVTVLAKVATARGAVANNTPQVLKAAVSSGTLNQATNPGRRVLIIPRASPPQLVNTFPRLPQVASPLLTGKIQIPPGMRLVRSDSGQLMLVSQQALSQAQQGPRGVGSQVSRLVAPQVSVTVRPTVQHASGQRTAEVKVIGIAPKPAVVQSVSAVPQQRSRPQFHGVVTETVKEPPTHYSQETLENVKKCKNFLATLIKLACRATTSSNLADNIRRLVKGLLEGKLEAEEFTEQLYQELKTTPQPCLLPFLKKCFPAVRCLTSDPQLFIQQASTCISKPSTASSTIKQSSTENENTNKNSKQIIQQFKGATARPGFDMLAQSRNYLSKTSRPTPKHTVVLSGKHFGVKQLFMQDSSFHTKSATKETSESYKEDDDINDVTSMAGINLGEEHAKILTTMVGSVVKSCQDQPFLSPNLLHSRILHIGQELGVTEVGPDVVALVSHAAEEFIHGLLNKLTEVAQHHKAALKEDMQHAKVSDVRSQLRFVEEVENLKNKKKDEEERERLLHLSRSHSQSEDPQQQQLKQRAKELQKMEEAQLQQREANLTAQAAIGPYRKRHLEQNENQVTLPPKKRVTRVMLRDLLACMEQDPYLRHSLTLYKAML
ncbi:putative ATP-dependent RNA helicase DDX10 [Xyrichtys novacula]|uniref:Probable ATP-dependent RNA helicase DDX10 n=1 Tax=Xyrichtys novacula TaxID=13765 RepID=A0AAV1FT03_XYRNO|nr:putative ATP-dependent RNA helicase DDX10 [Xyrichtys novacula]